METRPTCVCCVLHLVLLQTLIKTQYFNWNTVYHWSTLSVCTHDRMCSCMEEGSEEGTRLQRAILIQALQVCKWPHWFLCSCSKHLYSWDELLEVCNAWLDAGIPGEADGPEELVWQRRRLCRHPAAGAADRWTAICLSEFPPTCNTYTSQMVCRLQQMRISEIHWNPSENWK